MADSEWLTVADWWVVGCVVAFSCFHFIEIQLHVFLRFWVFEFSGKRYKVGTDEGGKWSASRDHRFFQVRGDAVFWGEFPQVFMGLGKISGVLKLGGNWGSLRGDRNGDLVQWMVAMEVGVNRTGNGVGKEESASSAFAVKEHPHRHTRLLADNMFIFPLFSHLHTTQTPKKRWREAPLFWATHTNQPTNQTGMRGHTNQKRNEAHHTHTQTIAHTTTRREGPEGGGDHNQPEHGEGRLHNQPPWFIVRGV